MSVGIESYLSEAVIDIKIFYDLLIILKSALKNIECTVQSWSTYIYCEKSCELMSAADFITVQKKVEFSLRLSF